MRLDDLRPTDNVDDRRGGFGGYGPHLAVGGGGLGVIGILLLSFLFGVDPGQILNGTTGNGPAPRQRVESDGGPRADDASYQFARKIVGSAEDIWAPILQAKGVTFTPATFTAYDSETPTGGCGEGSSAAGPFYCPGDSHIYLDLSFFNELQTRFGSPGEFAQAYVVAHEYGHHIQNLMGIMSQHGMGSRGAGSDSVRIELQADCFAGVWAKNADKRFHILEKGDVEDGLRAANAVGDDTLEKESQGYVVPDSFTHGTSQQRVRWFRRGLDSGNMDSCDTFSANEL